MCRIVLLGVVLCAALSTVAVAGEDHDHDHVQEGGYGLRQRQREGRREANQGYTPGRESEEAQQESGSEARRQRQRQEVTSPEDSSSDGSSYRTVVLHSHQPQQRKKPTRARQKVNRQVHREATPNHATPTVQSVNLPPSTPAPGDPFVHAVHPSIMQNLLKQQPQTFDVPQEKETEQYERGNNWQIQSSSPNNGQGLRSFHSGFSSGDAGQQEGFDVSKRPIHVPNRVSVQSPPSDTSFNVGYSIGFGSGLAQPPRVGMVQPPVNLRHGKQLSVPASYQNTPVNVHIDGKNSVWKNMGSGVEMSHNVDSKYETPNGASNGEGNERQVYSSGSVINQPIFYREGFDHNLNSISTSGRNSFDHNHALQQSNPFDFSNAIDPMTHHPYSTEQKTHQFVSSVQPSFTESFAKQPIHSFTESFSKHPHSSYSETSSKQLKPIFVKDNPKYESPKFTHAVVTQNDHSESTEGRYESPAHEKPSFPSSLFGPVRVPNSLNINTKQTSSEFPKSNPGFAKSSYPFKSFGANSLNGINEEPFVNNIAFQGGPVLPSIYGHSGKIPPPGMVQAILVPVNSQAPSLPYPVGMSVLSGGYSPYFGHPVGMVRIPEPVGVNNVPSKEEYENGAYDSNHQVELKQQTHQKSPVKLFQTHYTTRHQMEDERPRDVQHPVTRLNSHPRFGDVSERSPKFKRVFSTEAPDHTNSPAKPHSSSSFHASFDVPPYREHSSFKDNPSTFPSLKEPLPSFSSVRETSLPHHLIPAHQTRPYRTKKLVIVKRT